MTIAVCVTHVYSNLRYLMNSKVGRCGEFANLFALFVRAVGLRGRYGEPT